MLAEKLNMTSDDAEKWIVNLIRNARLDAKIDSKLVGLSCFTSDIFTGSYEWCIFFNQIARLRIISCPELFHSAS